MDKEKITKGEIVTYDQLQSITCSENGEKLIVLNDVLECRYQKLDMLPYTGKNIYVRENVRKKLVEVNKQLKTINKCYELKVVYGYRHPDIQQKYFDDMKGILLKKDMNASEQELDARVHNFVAVPDVAGHPTGGAIDLTITTPDGDLNMGCAIADFSNQEKMFTFANTISKEASKNRILLHDLMVGVRFAPFYGEWWHFSYGDKEWAYFYGKKKSLYRNYKYSNVSM